MIDFKGKNILVCGGTGFIGLNIVRELVRNPTTGIIRVTYRTKRDFYDQDQWLDKVELVRADLTSKEVCEQVTKEMDYMIVSNAVSFGAKFIQSNPMALINSNTIMNVLLFESAVNNGVTKIVYFGSTTGYPESEKDMIEEDMFSADPFDKYFSVGWMKRYAEVLLRLYSEKLKKIDATVLRLTNVIGDYDKFSPEGSHVLPALIRKINDNPEKIEIWGNGEESRDIIHVSDVVTATLLALDRVEGFEAINIGSGKNITVNEMIEVLTDGADIEVVNIPNNSEMIKHRSVNVEKAKRVLSFTPKDSIETAILKAKRWYAENKESIYR